MPDLSENYQTTCRKFPALIKGLKILTEEEGFIKARIELPNGTTLHAAENRKTGIYSYYWLDKKDGLLMGWDNYPHYLKIKTFPFHKHIKRQKNIEESESQTLESVLEEIRKELSE